MAPYLIVHSVPFLRREAVVLVDAGKRSAGPLSLTSGVAAAQTWFDVYVDFPSRHDLPRRTFPLSQWLRRSEPGKVLVKLLARSSLELSSSASKYIDRMNIGEPMSDHVVEVKIMPVRKWDMARVVPRDVSNSPTKSFLLEALTRVPRYLI